MVNKIFKYTLVPVPLGSNILTVGAQGENIYVVNPLEKEEELRDIRLYGTGRDVPVNCGRFLGTVFLEGGAMVFHIFDNG